MFLFACGLAGHDAQVGAYYADNDVGRDFPRLQPTRDSSMNVGSVSSTTGPAADAVKKQPEAADVRKGGRDNDGDSDDGGAKAVQTPAPVVNMNGQKIGQIISVSA